MNIAEKHLEQTLLKQPSITSFLAKHQTLADHVAKYACIDYFSLNSICTSEGIHRDLTSMGFKPPKHPTDVMNLIYSKYEKVLEEYKEIISQNCDQRFSLDLDELTALTKKRYMNVNFFTQDKVINIGLV